MRHHVDPLFRLSTTEFGIETFANVDFCHTEIHPFSSESMMYGYFKDSTQITHLTLKNLDLC